jgi:hypothetical protein
MSKSKHTETQIIAALKQVETIESWRIDYNQLRPHSVLGYPTPQEFAMGCANEESKERFPHSHSLDGSCVQNWQPDLNPSVLTYAD